MPDCCLISKTVQASQEWFRLRSVKLSNHTVVIKHTTAGVTFIRCVYLFKNGIGRWNNSKSRLQPTIRSIAQPLFPHGG
jgi:hypothetical protein